MRVEFICRNCAHYFQLEEVVRRSGSEEGLCFYYWDNKVACPICGHTDESLRAKIAGRDDCRPAGVKQYEKETQYEQGNARFLTEYARRRRPKADGLLEDRI